ncbi:MAG: lipocalin family protein [Betaproteobacteria bacterium]|nr:lipocalin family protein [Betaproteobacteria bacterium]
MSSKLTLWLSGLLMLSGCQQTVHPPMSTVEQVDLQRFMGSWYVIASIPTFLEKDISNAIETYRLNNDGTVETVFTYHVDGVNGPLKKMTGKAFIKDTSHAKWDMQFIWPIKADYRIVYLAEDYSLVIVGREKRDYVWVMARAPQISEATYNDMQTRIKNWGYDIEKLKRVPQVWAK